MFDAKLLMVDLYIQKNSNDLIKWSNLRSIKKLAKI